MDVQKKLDEIVAAVAGARAMPMSASCVINRAELLARLEEVRAALPGSLAQARELIGGREQLVADAREEAERIIESARAHRGSLISGTEVARESREEAERILAEARREADGIRAEADDYVDSKLANFEVVLTKTRGSVERGREKLLGLGDGYDPEDPAGTDVPARSGDPATQRHNADAYVDAKLSAVSAVLATTLEAVGRGREKLLGARPADELGAHMAAQDGLGAERPTTDADFLAELAARPDHPAPPEPVGVPQTVHATHATHATHTAPPDAYPAYQDPGTAYPQTVPQEAAGYGWQQYPQQTDPYAAGGGYGWPAQDGGVQGYGDYQQQAPAGGPAAVPPQGGALDETSFFDTSMIDLEQLRRYEEGR
ncbi:cell division initiation protein [Streptomyces sp. I05A-00742]|uniref:cell division initiation protein n=1 Tax=Streptomyces sp. I05A-00742 TaxID=2732853 RepID=UPI001487B778|nr:cell division initiation protein [Streptomyces sp. I05A-00742]